MMKLASPFRPSFGVTPPRVSGRDEPLAEVGDALAAGAGAAARMSLVTGARGIGKTVLMNAVEDEARRRGWLVVDETLTPGLLGRVVEEHVPAAWRSIRGEAAPDPARPSTRRRVTGVGAPGGLGSVSTSLEPVETLVGLRPHLTALCDALAERGAGLLITLDEIHRVRGPARDDVVTLAATIQHLWREERAIAFFGAGLPAAVQDLLNDDVVTFLRRAERFDLAALSDDETADALADPVRSAGRRIGDAAVAAAVAAAQGYPYLVQVVGDLAWKVDAAREEITFDDVESVLPRAIRSLGDKVHGPAVADLSVRDRDFLRAMTPDDGPTRIADVGTRLGVDHGWVSRYRHRLLVAGLVRPAGRGHLTFALPYLREYLARG